MSLSPGTRLGPYEIAAKIGAGGMGEVYRATDTNLARQVAVKVLPDAVASDADRLARFDREAKTLAALNHPNIAAIYGLERADGHTALVMELVEGPTLADRIAEGPMAFDEALSIARQIAEALEAAHERGIIHRDLKPANVKVRADGTVKVLDFGLAKALGPDGGAAGSQSMSPTITSPAMTQTGLILGTAGYMSPEQAKGKPTDKRADIWAFGVVLLEMLTGRQAFVRETVTETLGAVMLTEPDWTAVGADVPESVRMVLRRCLQKDPKQRLADMQDVRLALAGAFATSASTGAAVAAAPTSSWRLALPVAVAALLVGVAAGSLAVRSQTRPAPPAVAQFEIGTPAEAPPGGPAFNDLAISRDGSRIVYASGPVATSRLFVRRTDQLEATELRGADAGANNPFFSPDGEQVGFIDIRTNALKRVSVLGGPATTIATLTAGLGTAGRDRIVGASWGPDGTIIWGSQRSGLWRLSVGSGEATQLTKLDDGSFGHWWPEILPNGKGVLFTIWGGSPQLSRIAVVSLETGKVTELLSGGSGPRYVATGHIVYGVNGGLQAVGFDQDQLALTGSPVSVVEGALTKDNTGAAVFDVAGNGSLVYMSGIGGAPGQSTLVWVDRRGREEALPLSARDYFQAFVSPDGSRIAATIGGPGQLKLWTTDLSRPSLTPIPTGDVNPFGHVWTRDSREVVFGSVGTQISRTLADGTGTIERLATVDGATFVSVEGWAGDGKTLLFTYNGADGQRIGSISTQGDDGTPRAWRPLMSERAQGGSMLAVSPDGKWIAYQSVAPGQYSVYLERFPGLGDRQLISDERGGWGPLWSADGRELFYRRLGDGAMMVVRIQTSPALRIQPPEMLFQSQRYVPLTTPQPGGGAARQWDLGPDGRFLMIKQTTAASTATPHIILVQHWLEQLKRLVAAK